MRIPKVGVFPAPEWSRRHLIFSALSNLFDVEFVAAEPGALHDFSHLFIFADGRRDAELVARETTVRSLVFLKCPVSHREGGHAPFVFSNQALVSKSFRGQTFNDKSFNPADRLERDSGDCTLGTYGDYPWWIRSGLTDIVLMDLPELLNNEYLFERLCEQRWVAMVPVMQFLQEASPWTLPPLRASFMFDDPNLHWKTYGYVNYQELARHASSENYCAAFATVPMDAWYVNRSVAAIFRTNRDRLSLLVHGNDHTASELMRTEGAEARRALSCQALERIERLEQKAGVQVARVMAAPHGACNAEMASALAECGFEAACISRGSLMGRNSTTTWPTSIGLNVSEMFGGLPILPRFNIKKERNSVFNARVSAFLGQPIIPVGHHDDVADGTGLLSDLAAVINSLGDVRWMSLKSISETNFVSNREGATVTIKMYSRRVRLKVAAGVVQLVIRRPWLERASVEQLTVCAEGSSQIFESYGEEPIAVNPGLDVEVLSHYPIGVIRRGVEPRVTTLSAIARRHVCETRDRLRPIFRRMFKGSNVVVRGFC